MRKHSYHDQSFDSPARLSTYRAGVLQSTVHRLLKKFTDDCLASHELSTMHWFILGTIYDAGPAGIGITKLSQVIDTNVPYVTNTLNKLEARHMVSRQPSGTDSRAKVVVIHPSFAAELLDIEADLREQMRRSLYTHISPEELRTYLVVLQKLGATLENYN